MQMRAFARRARLQQVPCLVYGDEAWEAVAALGLKPIGVVDSLLREVDLRRDTRPREALAADLLAVGRLSAEKGFDILLEALVDLEAEGRRPAVLRLVGSGDEEPALRELAARLGVTDRVLFDGHVAFGPELFARYASCDLVVIPSRTEGVPTTAYEAMAFGKPVLATDVGGLPEVIGRAGERGRLVPPEDPAALARAGTELLADRAALEEAGARGRAFAAEITLERQVRSIVEQALPHLVEDRG
jgi:glycosyltransferase involved in cell wall biosynthesis